MADAPCFAVSTIVVWRKRVWRCAEPAGTVVTFSEQHPLIAPRAKLSTRAVSWATHALSHDPTWELITAWQYHQQLRSIYHAPTPGAGRLVADQVIASFPTCPIHEVARLGRTLRAWRQQVLAYFDTGGVFNGGTEAINLLIEKPAAWPTLPHLRPPPATHPARRQRNPTLPTTTHPRLDPKNP